MKHYYEAYEVATSGWYKFKVYFYYPNNPNKEIILHRSEEYMTKEEAEDAAAEWLEKNNIDAELS